LAKERAVPIKMAIFSFNALLHKCHGQISVPVFLDSPLLVAVVRSPEDELLREYDDVLLILP